MGLIGHFSLIGKRNHLQLNVFSHEAKNVVITQQSIIISYAIQSIGSSTSHLRLLPGTAQSDRFFPLTVDKYSVKTQSVVCSSNLNFLETTECMFSV